jgi:hypothetical protein
MLRNLTQVVLPAMPRKKPQACAVAMLKRLTL